MKSLKIYNPNLLLEQLNISKVPNIGKIIRDSGIKVMSVSSRIMENYRALIFFDSDDNNIYVNKNLSKEAKRFIATYMYSYIQLYYSSKDDKPFHKSLCEEEIFDKKAYQYALRLLMPEKIFERDVEQGLNNRKLARKYKVSMFLANERRELMDRDRQKAKFKVIQGRRG